MTIPTWFSARAIIETKAMHDPIRVVKMLNDLKTHIKETQDDFFAEVAKIDAIISFIKKN